MKSIIDFLQRVYSSISPVFHFLWKAVNQTVVIVRHGWLLLIPFVMIFGLIPTFIALLNVSLLICFVQLFDELDKRWNDDGLIA